MFYKMLLDRLINFVFLYTVLDMPRQIRMVCSYDVSVLCFVNNDIARQNAVQSLGYHFIENSHFVDGGRSVRSGSRVWVSASFQMLIYFNDSHRHCRKITIYFTN